MELMVPFPFDLIYYLLAIPVQDIVAYAPYGRILQKRRVDDRRSDLHDDYHRGLLRRYRRSRSFRYIRYQTFDV